ncbi:MAG: FAD-binding oxidoreductase, partial [Gammaproteobacteria bacterium]|nr:FAD-binding oxidoreductase [Gammaproteobacteria bacterium]
IGLKVVTGNGDILDLNQGLVKNNTGYDFRHLFIGSEGTLGLICEATLQLTRPQADTTVMVLGIETFAAIVEVLQVFKTKIELTAFEFFSQTALDKVIKHQGHPAPFATQAPYYALVEFETSPQVTSVALALFEQCAAQGWVLDGVVSQSLAQTRALWRLREDISETLWHWQPYKNDISVRVSKMPDFLAEVDQLVAARYPDFEIVWYGHIGDGNLHLNILKPQDLTQLEFFERCGAVSLEIGELLARYDGSISAEHGVGLLKKSLLPYSRSPVEIALMRSIKTTFDPKSILNPGKVFDS